MPVLFRDFETRSTLNLRLCGAHKYASDPTTAVWCCAFAIDNGPVQLWLPGQAVPPEFIEAANSSGWIVSAFNDSFERAIEQHIMVPRYGFPLVPLDRHRCSQAAAQALALPASLKAVAKALDIEHQKDEAGQRLMLQMSHPRRARKGEDPNGIYWFDDEERRKRLFDYCRQDVLTERAVHNRIGHLSDDEQAVWLADAIINDRGIRIDRKLVAGAVKVAAAAQEAIDQELCKITSGAVETVSQVARLIDWLKINGAELKDVRKDTIEKALTRTDLSMTARRALELRHAGAHIAATKFTRLDAWADDRDHRVRGALKYHGASTGRWASYGVQLQNIKKPNKDEGINAATIKMVTAGDYAGLDDPLRAVGEITRAAICAAPDHRFIAADFSGIESRVLGWLAGEQSKIDLWVKYDQTGDKADDPYLRLGLQFGFPADTARGNGKTADLAFGYAGGRGAYKRFAGEDASDEDGERLKQLWRDAHPAVVALWADLDRAAKRAVANPNTTQIGNDRIAFRFDGTFLRMRLPSGRKIAYPFARLAPNERDEPVIHFKDNTHGKFVDHRGGHGAWPGLWVQNAVQAIARDLLAAAILRLEAAGYPIVLTVHDEIVSERRVGEGSKEEFLSIMLELPAWAEGLPVNAKVRNGPRFAEIETATKEPPPWVDDAAPITPETPMFEQPKTKGHDHKHYDWSNYASGEQEWGEDVAEYIYCDMSGAPYLKVKRTAAKQFPQYHYDHGEWIKGEPKGPKIPYRLPELLSAAVDTPVFICEGEKDADSVAALGLIATTNSGGAGKWRPELSGWFVGRKIAYVLEDNDQAGRDHAKMVARSLKGVVLDVRIVSFSDLGPKGDVSDWLDQGHTKAELIERCKAAPIGGHALDVRNIGELKDKPKPRGWLLGNSFCRRFLSQLQADGGVGKTALRYAQYLSVAFGKSLTGEHVFQRGRVLILSLEDDIDELERRLWAAIMHHDLDPKELDGWLYYQALGRDAGKIKQLDEKGRVVDGELVIPLDQTITDLKIDLVGLDPFVKCHNVGENNNDAIDAVAQVLTDMGHKHDLAVDAPHHTGKGQADPGNAQKGRGASALVDAARLVYTLNPMSAEEAKSLGIPPEECRRYIRLDRGKLNIAPPARVAKWFELVGVPLGNGNELYPNGDSIQTVKMWTPPDAWKDFDVEIQNAVLDTISAGLPNGRRYSDGSTAAERAAWKAVQKHAPDKTEAQAREIIKAWVRSGVLRKEDYEDPERRTKVKGLFVDDDKRPK